MSPNLNVMHSTQRTYDDVRAAFDSGNVVTASREELEQLLLAIGRARILNDANQARAAEMGETMRQLLAVRQSQEMHGQALRISKVALWFAVGAFIVSLVQAVVALNIVAPLGNPILSLESKAQESKAKEQQQPPSQKTQPPPKS